MASFGLTSAIPLRETARNIAAGHAMLRDRAQSPSPTEEK